MNVVMTMGEYEGFKGKSETLYRVYKFMQNSSIFDDKDKADGWLNSTKIRSGLSLEETKTLYEIIKRGELL